jgi:hypothetical protein
MCLPDMAPAMIRRWILRLRGRGAPPVEAYYASILRRSSQAWGTVTIGLTATEICSVVQQSAALVGEALTVLRTEEGIQLRGGGDVSALLYIAPQVVGD